MASPDAPSGPLERRVLQALVAEGGQSTTGTLNAALGTRPSDLLRILNRCVARGLVTRAPHPDRGRPRKPRFLFTITDAGRARLTLSE